MDWSILAGERGSERYCIDSGACTDVFGQVQALGERNLVIMGGQKDAYGQVQARKKWRIRKVGIGEG